MHHSIELFHQPTLMHSFLYSLTICLLHYYPRRVSSINMPIFRRKNCIHTASGIFALCKRLHNTLVESGLSHPVYCADIPHFSPTCLTTLNVTHLYQTLCCRITTFDRWQLNFKFCVFNKEPANSLMMIWMIIETCWSVLKCFNL